MAYTVQIGFYNADATPPTDNISLSGNNNATATLSGTVQVDYSAATVQNAPDAPVVVQANGMDFSFTSYTMTVSNNGATFQDVSTVSVGGYTGVLEFVYVDQQPGSLVFASFMEINTTTGAVYSFSTIDEPVTSICFASGTLIRTPFGETPVDSLRAGDAILTASGESRPVKWIGHREFWRDPCGRKHEVVRISAHAFGPDRPSQDLVVSPGHSICIDVMGEVMIQAMQLVNGATIARERVEEVTLWHVELDSHDVLIANDLPAESYLAMGNRGFFEEAGATMDLLEEGVDRTHADFCRPVVTGGPTLACVRERLSERAKALGWTPRRAVDLRLVVDGVRRRPATGSGAAAFVFPASATDVRLESETFEPVTLGSTDPRRLGVLLTGLVLSATSGEPRRIDLADERLSEGVHDVERNSELCWRWTDGELVLDRRLWQGLSGSVFLLVSYADSDLRGWNAPVRDEPDLEDADQRPRLYAIR